MSHGQDRWPAVLRIKMMLCRFACMQSTACCLARTLLTSCRATRAKTAFCHAACAKSTFCHTACALSTICHWTIGFPIVASKNVFPVQRISLAVAPQHVPKRFSLDCDKSFISRKNSVTERQFRTYGTTNRQ